jgi:hypothetical protein
LTVCEAVKGQMDVFCDGVGVVDSVYPLAHKNRLLLKLHGLGVVAHDVVEASDHAQTLGNFGVHGSVHIVQQIERLRD